MPLRIAVIGAAGKIGTRITRNLAKGRHELALAEKGEAGLQRLREAGYPAVAPEEAVASADMAILAVPDARMREVTEELAPHARPGAIILMLDPAAAAAGEVALRDGLHYVVCHPCHPPLFGDQPTEEARRDFFGGVAAEQDVVIALLQGSEEALAAAESVCREAFAPVRMVHRITVEQMAVLEPAMAEVVAASAAVLMREALDAAVEAGVPPEAARAFMLGHVRIVLAILFGEIPSSFSDAAKIAVGYGQEMIYQPDWRKVFQPERIREVIRRMLHPEESTRS